MLFRKLLLFLALAGSLCFRGNLWADDTTGAPVLVDVGNSNNPYVSYLVIDDTSLGNSAIEYAWYYSSTTEAGTTNPLTGDDLVNAVIAGTATNSLYALTPQYDPLYSTFLTGFQIGSQTSAITTLEDPTVTAYWTYWISGGSQTLYGSTNTVTPTNWAVAPNTSLYRTLTNGSYDGWTLSPFDSTYTPTGLAPLSLALVPEPSVPGLLLFALLSVAGFIRWKSARRA